MKNTVAFSITVSLMTSGLVSAGPKGTVFVPPVTSPITIDGDFGDWPLSNYTMVAEQPLFPDGQGVGEPTSARGDHLVWDIRRIGPFNGTIPEDWDPETPSEYGSSVYLAYDNNFLYVLGVFIDDEPFGELGEDGFSNFLNDGFEFFIDAKNDSGDDLVAEFTFPAFDEEDPNLDDFQFTMGLNEAFPPDPQGPTDLGVEVHMERAGMFEIVKEGYLEVRENTDLSTVGGRDVAAKRFDDLRAAGARNPEIVANPDTTFTGYAVELVVPFGIVDGFTPDHNMGFDLFWRDVDDPVDPEPGFGAAGILWADWNHAETVSATDEDGNLFHGGNWGQLEFLTGDPCDFDGDGSLGVGDIGLLSAEIRAGTNNAAFDVNGDGAVNGADLNFFVSDESKLHTWVGDSNLDGEFNSSDFVVVFQAGEYEDALPLNSTWATGDWNADGEFNSADFVAAFQEGGYELGPRWTPPAAVPEPSAMVLLLIGIIISTAGCRHRG